MSKEDFIRKISSRKFWAMFMGQITAILTAFNAGENVILKVTAAVTSIGAFAVYMLAEAKVDAARADYIETGLEFVDEADNETEVDADGNSTE